MALWKLFTFHSSHIGSIGSTIPYAVREFGFSEKGNWYFHAVAQSKDQILAQWPDAGDLTVIAESDFFNFPVALNYPRNFELFRIEEILAIDSRYDGRPTEFLLRRYTHGEGVSLAWAHWLEGDRYLMIPVDADRAEQYRQRSCNLASLIAFAKRAYEVTLSQVIPGDHILNQAYENVLHAHESVILMKP